MALDTFVVLANAYNELDDALEDYDAVLAVWRETTMGDTFDAAVITHRVDGSVKIVRRHEQPVLQGAQLGLGAGLAVGALAALFPAIGLAAGLGAGAAGGLGLGALAGHVTGGMSRADLRALGELLDAGHSGLVVVAAQDTQERVREAINRGHELLTAALEADHEQLESALAEAERTAPATTGQGPA